VKLKRANLELSEDNLKLSQDISKLSQDVSKLCADNVTLRRKTTPTDQRIIDLEQEIKERKERMTKEEPLVEVGVAIRLRFWEQSKEIHGLGKADNAIIEAGNRATHEGVIYADHELFSPGCISRSLLNRNSGTQSPHKKARRHSSANCTCYRNFQLRSIARVSKNKVSSL
jgi:hypothetical protein